MEIFVSYSWINEKPDDNVLSLVSDLRDNGYDAICDVILSQSETAIHFPKMMAEGLKKANKVIIVLSEKYKEKADTFKGGVGNEYQYIIEDIINKKQKYILVAFEHDRDKVTPDFLRGREILFLDKNDILCNNLLHKINETGQYIFPPVNLIKTKPTISMIGERSNYQDDIDTFSDSTPFFDYRIRQAFLGVRGLRVFDNPEECIKRLSILLKQPLSSRRLNDPIWYFRGSGCLNIKNFEIASQTKCIMGSDEIEIDKILVTSRVLIIEILFIFKLRQKNL